MIEDPAERVLRRIFLRRKEKYHYWDTLFAILRAQNDMHSGGMNYAYYQ